MKKNFILEISKSLIAIIFLSLNFNLHSMEDNYNNGFQVKAKTLPSSLLSELKANDDAADVIKKAEKEAQKILKEAENRASLLKEISKDKYVELKKQIEKDVAQISSKVESEGLKIGNQTEEEIRRIRSEAEQKALEIINKAEEVALKLKQEADKKKTLEDIKLKAKPSEEVVVFGAKKVTDDWRKTVSEQFYEDVKTVKNIILDGEQEEEKDDFLSRFKEQKKWFDKTVSGTQYFFDPNYNAVMQKRLTFDRLTKAQKKADEILDTAVDKGRLGAGAVKKLRLVALYELNSQIQDKVEKGEAAEIATGIEESAIKDIVDKVVADFKGVRVEVERDVKEDIRKMEDKLKKVKKDLEIQRNDKKKLEAEMKSRLEEKSRAKLELEIVLDRTKEDLQRLKQQAKARANEIETELKPELESKNRQNLELQTQLEKIKNEAENLKTKMAKAQEKAARETLLRKEAENKANLSMQVAKQKISDIEKKREDEMNAMRLKITQKEQTLQEKEESLSQDVLALEEEKAKVLSKEAAAMRLKQEAETMSQEAEEAKQKAEIAEGLAEKKTENEMSAAARTVTESELDARRMMTEAEEVSESTNRQKLEEELARLG